MSVSAAVTRNRAEGHGNAYAAASTFVRRPLPTAVRHFARHASARLLATLESLDQSLFQELTMGKYVLGWFLGVPLIVLVAIYFIAH